MRFMYDDRDAIQPIDVITLDVQPGDTSRSAPDFCETESTSPFAFGFAS